MSCIVTGSLHRSSPRFQRLCVSVASNSQTWHCICGTATRSKQSTSRFPVKIPCTHGFTRTVGDEDDLYCTECIRPSPIGCRFKCTVCHHADMSSGAMHFYKIHYPVQRQVYRCGGYISSGKTCDHVFSVNVDTTAFVKKYTLESMPTEMLDHFTDNHIAFIPTCPEKGCSSYYNILKWDTAG